MGRCTCKSPTMKWANVLKESSKKNSLKLNSASHNNTSWYTDTDGFLEHSPSGGSLYYKGPSLQRIILFFGGSLCKYICTTSLSNYLPMDTSVTSISWLLYLQCPSLSLVIAFVLKSNLSDISTATPACLCFHLHEVCLCITLLSLFVSLDLTNPLQAAYVWVLFSSPFSHAVSFNRSI